MNKEIDYKTVNIKILSDVLEFEKLEAEWNALYKQNKKNYLEQTWAYNYHYYINIKPDYQLILVVCRNNQEKLVGIIPLYKKKNTVRTLYRPGKLNFIGNGNGDYLNFVFHPEYPQVILLALSILNESKEWGIIEFDFMPEQSPFIDLVFQWFKQKGLRVKRKVRNDCVSIPLPVTYDNYLSALGKSTRKDARYDRNVLEKKYNTQFHIYSGYSEIGPMIDKLYQTHALRQEKLHRKSNFNNIHYRQFYQKMLQDSDSLCKHKLCALQVRNELIAAFTLYCKGDQAIGQIFTFNPEWYKLSVGNVLLNYVIEKLIDNGITTLDMTRGDEQYKFKWGGLRKNNHKVVIFRTWLHEYLYQLNEFKKTKLEQWQR